MQEIIKDNKQKNNKEFKKIISLRRKREERKNLFFDSVFHYELSKESELFNENSKYCTISWKHSNPINYKNFHENIVPLDWALNLLGYNMVEDDSIWREKLNNDIEFASKLSKTISFLKPITKEEYLKNRNK